MTSISKDRIFTYIMTFVFIQQVHIAALIFCTRDGTSLYAEMVVALLIQVAANTILHFALCVRGRVAPFTLPLTWATCLFTLYVYCFHIMPADDGGWVALVLGPLLLAPTLVISIFTCVIFYIVKWFRK